MQDLQLALSPGRVEQRNFGLWLNSWQVGKVLQALVVDQAPSGQLLLRLGAHRVTATTDLPVQKGATLKLEVTALTPTPTLKILNTNAQAPAPAATVLTPIAPRTDLERQLPALMARQGNVSNVFSGLGSGTSGANLLSLLGAQNTGSPVQALFKHLYQPSDLDSGAKLRQAVERSGLFFEARAQQPPSSSSTGAQQPTQTPTPPQNATNTQSTAPQQPAHTGANALLAATAKTANTITPTPAPTLHTPTTTGSATAELLPNPAQPPEMATPGDFKGDIQRLLKQVQQLLQTPQDASSAAQQTRENLTALRDQLDGALSHITLQQVACQASDAKGQTCFLIDIPVKLGEHSDELHLEIERDGKQQENTSAEDENWRITLRLNPPSLGPVAAKLSLRAQHLSVSLQCEQATTHALMSAQLLPLQSRLEQLGFEVTNINTKQSISSDRITTRLSQHFNIGVSERV